MGRKHFTEERITCALRRAEQARLRPRSSESSGSASRLCHRWKKQFAGLGVAELRRLRTLKEEKRKLEQLVADLSLDGKMLQDVLSKKI